MGPARVERREIHSAPTLGHDIESQHARGADQQAEGKTCEPGPILPRDRGDGRDDDQRDLDVFNDDEVPLHAHHACALVRMEASRLGSELAHETAHLRPGAQIETEVP
jgi:hypothetical protein